MFRNLRVIRMVRFFYELRQMLRAIFGSLKPLLWLGILLLLLLYFFAICFVSGVSSYLEDCAVEAEAACAHEAMMKSQYSSIAATILSLFKAITGGESWGPLMEPLLHINPFLAGLYLGFILFTVFAFMNAVTSTFVDSTMQNANLEKDYLISQELKQKDVMLEKLEKVFEESDRDNSGFLTQDEFVNALNDTRAMAYLRILGIDTDNLDGLFQLVDIDSDGSLEVHEFLKAIPRLMGPAASVDLAHLEVEIKRMSRRLKDFIEYSMDRFDRVLTATVDVANTVSQSRLGPTANADCEEEQIAYDDGDTEFLKAQLRISLKSK